MGALLWWIPWAVWVIGGLWAAVIVWRSSRSVAAKVAWTLVLALLPVLGVVLSIVVGHPSRSGRKRWRAGPRLGLGIGGLVVWLGVVVAALVAGGIV